MIQQSQLQAKAMFLQPENFHFGSSPHQSEELKVTLSLQSDEEDKQVAPTLSKKISKKSQTKDSPKPRRQKNLDDLNSNQKFGHWTLEENKRYHWFLQIHNNHFLNKHMRRTDKIFKSMALFVTTREAEQCRSHHQKMEKKHHTICNILGSLRKQHYGSQNEDLLIQDLRQNKVEIIDPILTSQFLQESRVITTPSVQNIDGQKSSQQQLEEGVYEVMLDEQKSDEDQIRLLPVKMECFDRDMVQMLLSEQAPHNNYLMI